MRPTDYSTINARIDQLQERIRLLEAQLAAVIRATDTELPPELTGRSPRADPLAVEVRELLGDGKRVHAVKAARNAGMSLKDANDYVERIQGQG